ncbi:MAG: mechanosensitive ion channel family protein [Desulfobacteraceae bacterium]|nr:MAG: mechanosensitive ion channel family protein [Desulfobacteraceae bacterium]
MRKLLESLLSRLHFYFDPERLGPFLGEGLISLVLVAVVLGLFYLSWRVLNHVVTPRLSRRLDKTSVAFTETIMKFGIMGIGIIAALSAAGVQTTGVLASLGVVGLTLGFALRETLSNIIAGILIFLDRPFTIDDLVEIDDKYGRVKQITLRTTRIVTNDGRMLAVPNAEVMNKTVSSYTNFPNLRLDVAVTVAPTEDLDHVRRVLLSLVQNDPDYLSEPLSRVVVTQLNDYSVALELQAWLRDERRHVEKRYELREKVFKALTAAGIEMPFQTIQLAPHQVILAESKNDTKPMQNSL